MHNSTSSARSLDIASWTVSVENTADGQWYVRPQVELGSYARTLTERLDYWAEHAPDRTFLTERNALDEWRRITYAQALDLIGVTALERMDKPPEETDD